MKTLRRGSIRLAAWALCIALGWISFSAQGQTVKPPKAAATPKSAYYIDPAVMDLPALITDPPAVGSAEDKAELAELHRIEKTRTPAQVTAAKDDEANESLFLYEAVLGPGFNADALPVTAELGAHVKNEQSVAGAALKKVFARPRPYQEDKTLHPPCAVTDVPNSYPSGHALTGYLEGLTLAEMVPEKRDEILVRADDYAHNRLVCGVHHASDVEASRRVAYVVFGYMLATPRFQSDLAAAKAETRAKLGLGEPAAEGK
ncbi:MAG: phosphatase PAP2 family protein [Acidobacteriaceae bacterium]|jgi:acid phosphatase (class A)